LFGFVQSGREVLFEQLIIRVFAWILLPHELYITGAVFVPFILAEPSLISLTKFRPVSIQISLVLGNSRSIDILEEIVVVLAVGVIATFKFVYSAVHTAAVGAIE
jgi:hypothetical protein